MKRWTILHEIGFACVVTAYLVALTPVIVLLSPLLLLDLEKLAKKYVQSH